MIRKLALPTIVSATFILAGFAHGNNVVQFNFTSLGGACDGVTDDSLHFEYAGAIIASDPRVIAGQPATLTLPAGKTCVCNGNFLGTRVNGLWAGIKNFTLQGNNTTIKATNCSHWGAFNVFNTNVGNTAFQPFQTVSAGASCVTMVKSGKESNFPVGTWVIAGGIGMQINSFPPNLGIFEYLQVASTPAGRVCFSTQLKNSYKQTWPSGFDSSFCANTSCGGPGTLYAINPNWDQSLTFTGLTFTLPDNQEIIAQGRRVTFNNVTINQPTGGNCFAPSLNQIAIYNNLTTNCLTEIDKDVDTIIYNGGNMSAISVQSSSISKMIFNNATVTSTGTVQNTICNNSTITNLFLGTTGFGGSSSFAGNGCNAANLRPTNFASDDRDLNGVASGKPYSISSGVISNTFTIPSGVPTWAVPGLHYFFSGQLDYEGNPFTITDMSQNAGATHFLLTTTLSGSKFPNVPNASDGKLTVMPDPARSWTCTNCIGNADMIDLSQAGAQNQPIYTYSSRTYTCKLNVPNVTNSIDINSLTNVTLWGQLQSITINVSRADTSSSGKNYGFNVNGRFNGATVLDGSDNVTHITNSVVLTTVGTRTVTASTVAGAKTGDSLSAFGTVTMTGTGPPWLGDPFGSQTDITTEPAAQCPIVTVTFQTSR